MIWSSYCNITIPCKGLHVQVPTSGPSGMRSELSEPRQQHHGFGLCEWHAFQWSGPFITFLRENFVEEDLCTLVSVYKVS